MEGTNHLFLDETVRNIGRVGESSPELPCRLFPLSTGKPHGNVPQNGDDNDKEAPGVGSLAELGHGCVDQIDERVLSGLDKITVRERQDESTGRPNREERDVASVPPIRERRSAGDNYFRIWCEKELGSAITRARNMWLRNPRNR